MPPAEPRSMSGPTRNLIRSNDSKSLWNFTVSPGWTKEECNVLRLYLAKHGVGTWANLLKTGCLPGKTPAQLNLQTQRLLGQQSTAEWTGLRVNAEDVYKRNLAVQGPNVRRKNGCLVNTGKNPTKDEMNRKLQQNREEYELTQEESDAIVIPKLENSAILLGAESNSVKFVPAPRHEKLTELRALKERLAIMEARLAKLKRHEAVDSSKCQACGVEWDDADDFSIQCDTCGHWYHGSCVGVTADTAPPGDWVCTGCRKTPISKRSFDGAEAGKPSSKKPRSTENSPSAGVSKKVVQQAAKPKGKGRGKGKGKGKGKKRGKPAGKRTVSDDMDVDAPDTTNDEALARQLAAQFAQDDPYATDEEMEEVMPTKRSARGQKSFKVVI